jgi:hypothetical protein
MTTDTERIDDAVLALLHLTLHDEAWAGKGFDPDTLSRLHRKGMIDDPAGDTDSVALTGDGLQRSKQLFGTMFIKQDVGHASMGPSKYPHIKVDLSDLGGQLWPVLRRVSYAMSDADVDEADIEQYKAEVRASSDPVAVSSRWVQLEGKQG